MYQICNKIALCEYRSCKHVDSLLSARGPWPSLSQWPSTAAISGFERFSKDLLFELGAVSSRCGSPDAWLGFYWYFLKSVLRTFRYPCNDILLFFILFFFSAMTRICSLLKTLEPFEGGRCSELLYSFKTGLSKSPNFCTIISAIYSAIIRLWRRWPKSF